MRRRVLTTLLASLGLLFLLLPAAQADQVQLYFTGNTSGGDSVPYQDRHKPPKYRDPTERPAQQAQERLSYNCDDHYDLDLRPGSNWNAYVIQGIGRCGSS